MGPPPHLAQLCHRCTAVLDVDLLLDEKPPGPKGYAIYRPFLELYSYKDIWPQLPQLTKSAESECGLCKLLHEAISSSPPKAEYRGDVTINLWRSASPKFEKPRIIYSFEALVYAKDKLPDGTVLLTKALFLSCSNEADMPFFFAPRPEVLSDQTVNFVKKAIDRCVSTCHPWDPSGFMPTRLLDIGDDSAKGRACLVLTKNMPSVKYAALSYCWGDAEDAIHQPKSHSHDLEERLTGFDVGTMSPIVRDAMIACQALGIRYLWVDALCILQGKADIEDWEHESQMMVEIFRNAFITLCPSSSSTCRQGFLAPRQENPCIQVRIPPRPNALFPGEARDYSIISYKGDMSSSEMGPFGREFTESNWFSRGWVWQEMKFSARLVIFGQAFVFYQCSDSLKCENGYGMQFADSTQMMFGKPRKTAQDRDPFSFFLACVEDFSQKDITYESDRLAALSGLAKQVSKETKSDYVGGLWMDNIHKDLVFRRKRRAPRFDNHVQFLRSSSVGPSWSWPGHGGGVNWHSTFRSTNSQSKNSFSDWKLECDDLRIATTKTGSNLFGQVSRGTLTITTKMASLAEIAASNKGNSKELVKKMLGAHLGPLSIVCGIQWYWDAEDIGVPANIADEVLVVLFSSCLYPRSFDRDIYGLLVYPAETGGEYHRLGSFEAEAPAKDLKTGYVSGLPITQKWKSRTIKIV